MDSKKRLFEIGEQLEQVETQLYQVGKRIESEYGDSDKLIDLYYEVLDILEEDLTLVAVLRNTALY